MKFSKVYFDENNQKVRWTQNITEDIDVSYDYVGKMTRVEFDLLIEILWEIFENEDIPLKDFTKLESHLPSPPNFIVIFLS